MNKLKIKKLLREKIEEGLGTNILAGTLAALSPISSKADVKKEPTEYSITDKKNTATGEGVSQDMVTAKKIAVSNAKTNLMNKLKIDKLEGSFVFGEPEYYRLSDGKYKCIITIEYIK
jgi:hypothetical protein